ncbi:hypothetical protein EV193_106209 [Herbihabitans rhizosphaerae]|uniref:Uncharacterized protein n=1 Tax=Herbihabitans rhizosphaerae TaxID=1872711 RepID=A0A4Q7KL70_9PSEU|nr:hypothetical protein [Herbihabitans rhizosphaerae]RZS36974.1 hypothetical protein EV193_106209 [Herbihabitans rhizosphaerae]
MTDWDDVDRWLEELRRRHWTLYLFGERHAPTMIAAEYGWPTCTDVLVMSGHDRAVAYRAPVTQDVHSPSWVHWWYASSAAWTLRAVLTLDPPNGRLLTHIEAAPPICHVPDDRRPLIIRPT